MERTEKSRTVSQYFSPYSSCRKRKFSKGPASTKINFEKTEILAYKSKTSNKIFKNSKFDHLPDKLKRSELVLCSVEESKDLKAYYRSRYTSLIKSIQETNKQKILQKELDEIKLKKIKDKLKDDLGLSNVKAKFNLPSEEIQEPKPEKPAKKQLFDAETPKKTDDLKVQRDNAEKIVKRAQDHLQKIAEKKIEEQKKEEDSVLREVKLRQTLKDSILNRNEDCEIKKNKSEKALLVPKKVVITEMSQYKKRYKLSENDKVFIIHGCYPDIRRALLAKGNWFENLDVNSPCFDLKWTVRRKDIDFDSLQSHQLCNHFNRSTMITTKDGLCRSLKNLIWFNSVDIDSFYPRCFDLSESGEKEDFFTEFKVIRAESLLKLALDGSKISEKVIKTAIKVTKRRLRDLDELIDDPKAASWELVTEKDWQVLSGPTSGTDDVSKYLPLIRELLSTLKSKYPQFDIYGTNNIWILKPAGLSRGRGIEIYNHLEEIKDKLQKEGQYVIQKYIENPLVVKGKKFDIRQWVLVTSWNPLTAWFYDHCYLRFGVEDYSSVDLKNKFVHLTNNSIQKNSEKFDKTEIEGNMWHSDDFRCYLSAVTGRDLWEEKIKPQIKKIATYTLECVQDMVDGRHGSCELYGYDIMIDEDYNAWLIEVNCSPAMDYSTQITELMVKDVMNDTVKIMVDYYFANPREKMNVDTGGFVLLVKSDKTVDIPINRFGLSLMCQGKAIK